MKVIGLTGRSGSGKSTLASELGGLGAAVLDGDRIAAELLIPGSRVLREVLDSFGYEYLTPYGYLDRKALGRLVFSDEGALRRLNSIVHPAFKDRMASLLEDLSKSDRGPSVAVLDAAVLYEAGLDSLCDLVVAVLCDEGIMASRISKREGIAEEDALARIAAQRASKSDFEIISRADIIVFSRWNAKEMRTWAERIMRISGGA
jgi:dephospho-CoA kinase